MNTEAPRILYLDYLRAALILLIVVEHASIAYTSTPWFNYFDCKNSGWFLIDSNARSDALLYIKSFRMSFAIPLLFLISGLFFNTSVVKRGAFGYAKSRLYRVGLPLLFIALVLDPWMRYLSCQFTWVGVTPGSFIGSYFDGQLPVDHGWFLWTLLVFEFIAILLWSRARAWYEGFCAWVQSLTLKPIRLFVTLLIASYTAYFLGAFTYDSSFSLFWSIFSGPFSFVAPNLFISLVFFFLGVAIGRSIKSPKFKKIEETLLVSPIFWLAVSSVLFAAQAVIPVGDEPSMLSLRHKALLNLNIITTPILCITLSLAALSLFKKYVNFPSAFMRYISGASYTIYVVHMPVCIWVSYILIPYNLPLTIKLSLSVLSGVLASLIVYEFLKLAYGALLFLRIPVREI